MDEGNAFEVFTALTLVAGAGDRALTDFSHAPKRSLGTLPPFCLTRALNFPQSWRLLLDSPQYQHPLKDALGIRRPPRCDPADPLPDPGGVREVGRPLQVTMLAVNAEESGKGGGTISAGSAMDSSPPDVVTA